jgi:hypothetical protein
MLNRAAGYESKEIEEASDPLCGGLLLDGDCACGVLWGAGLAAGVRARERLPDRNAARLAALLSAKACLNWYSAQGKPVDCGQIIGMKKWNMPLYLLKGNLRVCLRQLSECALDFHNRIDETLQIVETSGEAQPLRNCASESFRETARVIGLEEEDGDVLVAGLAGGLGLSGNGCGALVGAVFAHMLKYFKDRDKPKHSMLRSNLQGLYIGDGWMEPAREVVRRFTNALDTKKCAEITQTEFGSPEDLHRYLETGACNGLQRNLAESAELLAR